MCISREGKRPFTQMLQKYKNKVKIYFPVSMWWGI